MSKRLVLTVTMLLSVSACGGEEGFDGIPTEEIGSATFGLTSYSLFWHAVDGIIWGVDCTPPLGVQEGTPCAVYASRGFGKIDLGGYCQHTTFECQYAWACNGKRATHVGTYGDDVITGNASPNVIVGLFGNDVIHGKGGNDTICAGPGNDTIYGGTGNDAMFGEDGDDKLYGEGGLKDTCNGGNHVHGDSATTCETISGIP